MTVKLNVSLPAKGLVVDRPGDFVDQRSATGNQNIQFNRGIIRKRTGSIALGATLGERVQKIFELQNGSTVRLVRVGLTKVEDYSSGSGSWSDAANTALTGAETNQVSVAFPTLAGTKIAVFTNGKDNVRKIGISSDDADLGGSPPKAKFVKTLGPYTLLLNVTDGGNDYPSRAQWCDTGEPEIWAPASNNNAGSVDLLDDPEDIVGGGLFGNFIAVHKSHSIYVGQLVSTADVIRFDRRATGVGTVADATIQSLPTGEQIFLAFDGIHLFNGIVAPLIGAPINDEIREEANPAYFYKAQSIVVPELNEYWVCIAMGSDTEPQTVYKYNWVTQQAYKDVRSGLTTMALFTNSQSARWNDQLTTWDAATERWDGVTNLSVVPTVAFGFSSGATLRRTNASNDDNGVAVDGKTDTKDFGAADLKLADMDRMIRWKGIKLWAEGTAVTVYYSTDDGVTWIPAKTLTLLSEYPTDAAPLIAYFDAVSTRIRFRFANAVSEGSFTIKKYQLLATSREAVK